MDRCLEKTIELTDLLKLKYDKKIERPEEIQERDKKIKLYKDAYSNMLVRGYNSKDIFEMISDEFNNYVLSKDINGTKSEISTLEKEFDLFFKYKALLESSKELECLDNVVKEQIDNIKSKSINGYR